MAGGAGEDLGDLVAAGEAAGGDRGVRRRGAERGEEFFLGDLERKVVVLFFVAERTGHAATAGLEFANRRAGDAREERARRAAAEERLLVAMAVEENVA